MAPCRRGYHGNNEGLRGSHLMVLPPYIQRPPTDDELFRVPKFARKRPRYVWLRWLIVLLAWAGIASWPIIAALMR